MTEPAGHFSRLDTTVPHSARVWSYLLGGKDHFAIDRSAGDKLVTLLPEFAASARASRAFLRRAVRFLTAEVGIRQFLDIGPGLPTTDNTHEVAQAIAPESRIVYVDNDPMVLAHARVLLTSTVEGAADYIEADIRDLDRILTIAGNTLHLDEPIGVILVGVLSFLPADEEAYGAVKAIVDAVPAGSHVVLSHPTWEVNPVAVDRVVELWNNHGCTPMCARSPEAIERFFTGLEVLEPGVVSCAQWRPDNDVENTLVMDFAGVARKP